MSDTTLYVITSREENDWGEDITVYYEDTSDRDLAMFYGVWHEDLKDARLYKTRQHAHDVMMAQFSGPGHKRKCSIKAVKTTYEVE